MREQERIMDIQIRSARPKDSEFLAWLILTAGRAHVARGIWEVILGGTEQDSLEFLNLLAVTATHHPFHYSRYLIAAADGRPTAGLGGYDPKICGYDALYRAMPEVFAKLGYTGPDTEAKKRAERVLCCIPEDTESAWIIDSVATLPEYRRKGLVDRLLVAILEKGRQEGFQRAQISIYIGNRPAQRAYEKHGFKIVDEKRHPDFEAEIGSPGMARMLRNL
jgi:ribosomal protein S18 acetylase RimI-like enzyme